MYTSPMIVSQHKLEDGTIELTLRVPWDTIAKEYEEVVDEITKNTEIPGFRKGKAPKNIVRDKVDKEKAYEEVLKHVLPKLYNEAVTDLKLKPVINPKIELKEAKEGQEWVIIVRTAEKPQVTLGKWKDAIRDLNASKRTKIWVPGEKKTEESEKPKKPTMEELVTELLKMVKVTIPSILLEHEVNRLLSDLIDQTKKLGLTVDQYLASTGRNADALRREYEDQSRKTLMLELALEEIADKEGVILSDDDIDAVIKTAKSEEERKALTAQRYYLASLLRRQKTLDLLANL